VRREFEVDIAERQRIHEHPEFTVSPVNGKSYKIKNMTTSNDFDLATFTIPETGCPSIKAGRTDQLQQGAKLYTIGSPSRLTYTVTSGIFSGYRQHSWF
jgi:serine protease Do